MAGFVHLHTHTDASLTDGLNRVSPMVDAVRADNAIAVAATDHGSIGSWFRLHRACQATDGDVFPIYGQEMYLAIGDRRERNTIVASGETTDDGEDKVKNNYHLTVLAATETGYRNLIQLTNAAQDSFWNKPRIDLQLLTEYSEGLIVLTGCLGGPLTHHLVAGEPDKAAENLDDIVAAVGQENTYVELMEHGIERETAVQADLVKLARSRNVRWVVTNDAHFTEEGHGDAHDAWLIVGSKKTLLDESRWQFPGVGYWMKTDSEMRALRDEDWWAVGCDETVAIAERIGHDVMPKYPVRLPQFPLPDGYDTSDQYFKHLIGEGARERYGEDPDRPGRLPAEVNQRIKFEYDTITGAGFADYFLIVWDMISWARSQGILVGPGRGSGAGSLIAYVLGITQVEPLKHGLLFERFLDPHRVGMPDFDVDFEKGRRDEVVGHLVDMYGAEAVAKIGTRGIVRSRSALKDAGRVMGLPTSLGNRLASLVPIDGAKPRPLSLLLDPAAESDPQVQPFLAEVTAGGDEARKLVELARLLEDVTRSESIHACGVLVSDQPMDALVPVRRDRDGEKKADADVHVPRVTSWEGEEVEALGFLKIDVLGLRTLDVLSTAARYVFDTTGEAVDAGAIHPDHVTDEDRDRRAWELIAAGSTEGVFQLESPRMTELAMDVRPTSLEDVTALVALYRPGPMAAGMHTRYADRKRGREKVDYSYLTRDSSEQEVIGNVLGSTLGVITYQEQVMRLAGDVGGLNAGQRNQLRKAFSKKLADEMDALKDIFVDGGVAGAGTSGVAFARSTLEELWRTFEGSASYLFNASHAAAYGVVAYATAYMKATWPAQFAAALLAVTKSDEKRAAILRSLKREGIQVLAPDVNVSQANTAPSPDGTKVMFGLSEIKGFGKIAQQLVQAREADGPFTSVADLMGRVEATSAQVEALIEAGAFDAFGTRKGQYRLVRAARGNAWLTPDTTEWGVLEKAGRQRARTGVTVGEHPMQILRNEIRDAVPASRAGMPGAPPQTAVARLGSVKAGTTVRVVSLLVGWEERPYKKGRMAVLTLEGSGGEQVEAVVWNDELVAIHTAASGDSNDALPAVGQVVMVQARVSVRSFSHEVTGDDGETREEVVESIQLTVSHVAVVDANDGGINATQSGAGVGVADALTATDELPVDNAVDDATAAGTEPSEILVVTGTIASRSLPLRVPPMNHANHLIPPDALQGRQMRSWRQIMPSGVQVDYLVAGVDVTLHDMSQARKADASTEKDGTGFSPVVSDDPTTS